MAPLLVLFYLVLITVITSLKEYAKKVDSTLHISDETRAIMIQCVKRFYFQKIMKIWLLLHFLSYIF